MKDVEHADGVVALELGPSSSQTLETSVQVRAVSSLATAAPPAVTDANRVSTYGRDRLGLLSRPKRNRRPVAIPAAGPEARDKGKAGRHGAGDGLPVFAG